MRIFKMFSFVTALLITGCAFGQDQASVYYQKAAKMFRDAAAKTKCPTTRGKVLIEYAEWNDRMVKVLAGTLSSAGPQPTTPVPECEGDMMDGSGSNTNSNTRSGVNTNATTHSSLAATSSDAVGSAIGLTIDLINQGKRKKWSREYLEKANEFQSSYGITIDALENAVETNDTVAMKQLIAKGFDINVNIISQKLTLLCYAADKNSSEIVSMLLKAGADINKGSLNNPDLYGGLTPLHCAAFNGNLELAKFLVEHGANVNAQMQTCRISPLWEATIKNRTNVIRYLISGGADRSATVKWDNGASFRINWTPYQYAKKYGFTEAADIIGY